MQRLRCALRTRRTGDNWNLDRVWIQYAGSDGFGPLLDVSGAPLVRFNEDTTRGWSHTLAPLAG